MLRNLLLVFLGAVVFTLLNDAITTRLAQDDLAHCKRNLNALARAMEMYATDFSGHYPKRVERLWPRYMPELPTCSGTLTYASVVSVSPDRYTLRCASSTHPPLVFPSGGWGCPERP